jgi:hypothetical protein
VSRYLILVLLNLPLIIAGVLSAVVSYKLKRGTFRNFLFRITLWLGILIGLIFAQPIYNYLFSEGLTQTEPLSLFDVILITGVLLTLFISNRAHIKADKLERRVNDLHQEISIKLSEK